MARKTLTPYDEIDLNAQRDGFTIFLEVQAGSSNWLGPAEIAVTPRKQRRTLFGAEHNAQQNGWSILRMHCDFKDGRC